MQLNLGLRSWLVIVGFLVLYGLAVFAGTRAYYTTPPVARSAAVPAPASDELQRYQAMMSAPSQAQDVDTLISEADGHFERREYRQASAAYARALKLAPQDVELHNNLGLTLHYQGRTADAVAALKEGVQVDPSYQRIWLTLGFVQAGAGDTAAARTALQRAVDLAPASPIGQEAERILGRLP